MNQITGAKSEILASLSHALDLVEGQPRGHAVRTCLITSKLGRLAGLSDATLSNLMYASLLKDSGCSNNSARIQKIFGGDDILCKARVKFVDWSNPIQSLKYGLEYTEKGSDVLTKLRRLASNIAPPNQIMAEVTLARCSRGAQIALELGFEHEVSEAIHNLDEHWDGQGAPTKMSKDEIPLLSRIIGLAQTLEVFAFTFGVEAGYKMLAERNKRWFDPEVVAMAFSFKNDNEFWERHRRASTYNDIADLAVAESGAVVEGDADRICEAYASIIDAKSTFTGEHSTRVTQYAVAIASHLGMDAMRLRTLRRAALLHDIGKLGVSNRVLDKPAKLTDEEFAVIKLHPRYSNEILKPISGFSKVAEIASRHHERLDGKGYWQGLSGDDLDLETRCLTVADILDALHARRPYRDAMPMLKALAILDEQVGTAVDGDCVCAARELFGEQEFSVAA